MNFGKAIKAAKEGKKIRRRGWNGKNQWVVLMPELHLPPFNSQGPGAKVNDSTARYIGEDQHLFCCPYFVIYTEQKVWQPGWLASQTDMLAEDWEVL